MNASLVRIFQVVALLCPIGMPAFAATIDFDSSTAMGNSPGASVPVGARLSNQFQSSTGAVFSSGSSFVAVVNLGVGHATSGSNGIGGVSSDALSYGTPFQVMFTDPLNPLINAVTNFVSIRGDQNAISGNATLTAFAVNGSILGSTTVADTTGGLTLSFTSPGIHSFQVSETSSTIAFDDVTFNAVQAVAGVPEPSTYALMLAGIGLVAFVARRRRVQPVAA